jgi:hypothetical protein
METVAVDQVQDNVSCPSRLGPLTATFLVSMAALYFELLLIRYIGTEIRIFAYLKNIVLIAGFCGIGVGMVLAHVPVWLKRWFPILFAGIFLVARFSEFLHLTHIGFASSDEYVWGMKAAWSPFLTIIAFVAGLAAMFSAMLFFFVFLGCLVGKEIKVCRQLPGYSANLAGSLAGMLLFTVLSFYQTGPAVWILIGCLLLTPFLYRQRLLLIVFAAVILISAVPQHGVTWSPYYRIAFFAVTPPPGWSTPPAYELDVNHDYHQKIVDLSAEFTGHYPDCQPNKDASLWYDLPYKMIDKPGEVLVVGAGTGNDVAAALRHGATHVDAVEIDPVIAELGRRYHPEHPYESTKVTVIVNDARAFFNRSHKKYDVIVYGHLDSHTLLSSFSSLRLDNYVYTVESFRHSKDLLREGGTIFVAFASGTSFVTGRQFATMTHAFGSAPRAFFTGYDSAGVLFIHGKAHDVAVPDGTQDITQALMSSSSTMPVTTDAWPFLYLPYRKIPLWTLLGLVVVWLCVKKTVRNTIGFGVIREKQNAHFFLLGAGFLLLETNAVSRLALLFGSTWLVNAIVISAFLLMALAANMLILKVKISRSLSYACLAIALIASAIVPYDQLSSSWTASLGAGLLIALPVFFSGLIFSTGLKDVESPSTTLGVNILGAVLGGLLENLAMIGGTPFIAILALILYAGSALMLKRATTESSKAELAAPSV